MIEWGSNSGTPTTVNFPDDQDWFVEYHDSGMVIGVEDTCPPDLNKDGVVDVVDILALMAAWLTQEGDINDDGVTDVLDLLEIIGAWGACNCDFRHVQPMPS